MSRRKDLSAGQLKRGRPDPAVDDRRHCKKNSSLILILKSDNHFADRQPSDIVLITVC